MKSKNKRKKWKNKSIKLVYSNRDYHIRKETMYSYYDDMNIANCQLSNMSTITLSINDHTERIY